ncbi:hypothetical protein [Roseibium alexandrii]|uniref:Uncharacterized protein n=1 Tax=Roseibium alexandrii TaxID=388408 RepID=A0A0M6ZZ47_9HYPH|nr:hypothetical protein [Roseibium alexandrii]CTQ67452.1 hypothetical protein LAX5112_01397 [Roseibium alexandrii]
MIDQKDVRLDNFIVALKRLHLAQVQLANFQDRSKADIRQKRHTAAEYSISWLERLEQDLPKLQQELAVAFGELHPRLQADLEKIICEDTGLPHLQH